MELHFKRVRFGDCALLETETQRLILDCGSGNRGPGPGQNARRFAFSAAQPAIDDALSTDLLVSHFHSDHFCGFLSLPLPGTLFTSGPVVGTAYLPWSITDGAPIFSGAMSRLLAAAPAGSYGFRLSRQILALFDRLERCARRLCFVRAGDRIPVGGERLRVLWPRVDVPVMVRARPGRGDFFQSWWDEEDDSEQYNYDLYPYSALDTQAEELFRTLFSPSSDLGAPLYAARAEFSAALGEYLTLLHQEEAPREAVLDRGRVLREALAALLEHHDRLWLWLDRSDDLPAQTLAQNLKQFSNAQYHHLVDSLNAVSVVCDLRGRALFLADAPPHVVDHIAHSAPGFSPFYQVIKLPHHGTGAYFTGAVPPGDHYILSNGGFERRAVGCNTVSFLADRQPNCQLHCTDAHTDPRFCRYRQAHGSCAPNCRPVSGSEWSIPI